MNRKRGAPSLRFGLALVLVALTAISARAQSAEPEPQAAAAGSADEQNYILYQLRAGEDPSKVAKMFHLTVEELLALNRITDPHRLGVGATLKIPDPRATRLLQLQKERDASAHQLAAAQGTIGDLQKTIQALESQVTVLHEAKETLERDQVLYPVWRAAVFISAAAALAAAIGLLMMWAKARDEARRRHLAVKEADRLHAAAEKHRQLSAQFELKYQNLFHQAVLPPAAQDRAQTLRRAYEEDRARLDAIVAEAEREIKGAAATQSPEDNGKRSKAPVVRLSAARKSG